LKRLFKETLPKAKSKLLLWSIRISTQIKSITGAANSDDESTESSKAFYLLSLMLIVSLLFFAPDKIPQTFTLTQAQTGIFEKAQEIVKKLVANFS